MIELIHVIKCGEVSFKILIQTERIIHFLCSNGWTLKTMNCPEVVEKEKTLFLRGAEEKYNYKQLVVSKKTFEQIQEAIKEYNEFSEKTTCEKKENKMIMEISFKDENKTYSKMTYNIPEGATYVHGAFASSEEDEYGSILVKIPKKTVTKYLWEVGGLWITKEYFTAEEIQKRSNMLNIKKVKGSEKEVEV